MKNPHKAPHLRFRTAAVICTLALAGCASAEAGQVVWDGTYDFGTPGEATQTYRDVTYYPACGNEILTWEDVTWYPFEPSNAADLPSDPLADAPSPSPTADAMGGQGAPGAVGAARVATGGVAAEAAVGTVVAPGPGDDAGTLVVYENGLAYWVSDSRGLDTWLTDRELEYNWAC